MMMMKVVVGGAAAAAALVLSTGTATAAPGQTQSNGPIGEPGIPITCAGPGTGVTSFAGTGNTINHFNSNNNGGWGTTTQEGTATLVITPNGGSSTTYTGHVQEWDAGEFNKQNAVMHATLNFDGTNVADGTVFHLHANFDVTTNPAGATTASHFNVTCS